MTSDSNTPNARTQEENTSQQRLAVDENDDDDDAESETAQAKKRHWIAEMIYSASGLLLFFITYYIAQAKKKRWIAEMLPRIRDRVDSADAVILLDLIYDTFSSLEGFDQGRIYISGDKIGFCIKSGWWSKSYIEMKTDSDRRIVGLYFKGEFNGSKLPSTVARLQKLKEIRLRYCGSLPVELKYLPPLEKFHIKCFLENIVVPDEFRLPSTVEEVYVDAYGELDSSQLSRLFDGFPETLKRINIDSWHSFPFEVLGRFRHLKGLAISGSQNIFETIPEGFRFPSSLEEVHVNACGEFGSSRFSNGLPKTLRGIRIRDFLSFRIHSLAEFSCLERIELWYCSRELFEAENIPENFHFPSSLRTVKIVGSHFVSLSPFLNTLPSTLVELCFKGIQEKYAGEVQAGRFIPEKNEIIRCLRDDDLAFPNLTRLEITDFQLSAGYLIDIRGRFPNLRELDVHNNRYEEILDPKRLETLAKVQTDDGRIHPWGAYTVFCIIKRGFTVPEAASAESIVEF